MKRLRVLKLDEELMKAQERIDLEEFAKLADLPTPVFEEDYQELEKLRASLGKRLDNPEQSRSEE